MCKLLHDYDVSGNLGGLDVMVGDSIIIISVFWDVLRFGPSFFTIHRETSRFIVIL